MYTVSITSQGQISIPAKLRKKLGLHKGKKANVSMQGDSLVVKPVKDFLDLAGSIAGGREFKNTAVISLAILLGVKGEH